MGPILNRRIPCKCGLTKDYRAKRCNACYQKEKAGKANPNYKHGHACKTGQTKTYMIWSQIIARCTNKKNKGYKEYGGRGIKVCKQWLVYEKFLNDMGEKPKGLSIERINNDKGYYKSNCKWATDQEQTLNRGLFKNKTSKYKGVCWHKRQQKWSVSMTRNKKSYYGGSFYSERQAYKAYLKLKKKINKLLGIKSNTEEVDEYIKWIKDGKKIY